MRFNQDPISGPFKQRFKIGIELILTGIEKRQALPVANPRHQVDAQQIGEPKHGRGSA